MWTVRRTVGLVCALGLIGIGLHSLGGIYIAYENGEVLIRSIVAASAVVIGASWLWEEVIKPIKET
jgi:hypothetical protein